MRKIAVVSFGMSDMVFPLLKHFSCHNRDVAVDLFLIYGQDKKKEGIVNFSALDVENGFVRQERLADVLGPEILSYTGDSFGISVFIYHNQKAKALRNFPLSYQLIRRLRAYDLIHVNGMGGAILHLLPFLKFKKWILSVHDFHPHSGEASRSATRLLAASVKQADRIIIQNRPDFEDINAHYPDLAGKTSFLPFGYLDIYRSFSPPKLRRERQSDILFFGRISKYKGLEYLLDALEILERKGLRPEAVIAGGGSYDFGHERVKQLAQVTFYNRYIENSELAELICQTKVVVCPYTDATQSGVLMTAFAFGKPVIATDVGGFKDAVVNGVNGFLIPPQRADQLARALENLLTDPVKLSDIEQRIQAYEQADQFRWENIARGLRSIYQQVLAPGPVRKSFFP
jgi:glycosyltransferase involved in cell wall biosynthesis